MRRMAASAPLAPLLLFLNDTVITAALQLREFNAVFTRLSSLHRPCPLLPHDLHDRLRDRATSGRQ